MHSVLETVLTEISVRFQYALDIITMHQTPCTDAALTHCTVQQESITSSIIAIPLTCLPCGSVPLPQAQENITETGGTL